MSQAAETGQLHELKRRLDSGEPVDRKDVYGKTPLHYAVSAMGSPSRGVERIFLSACCCSAVFLCTFFNRPFRAAQATVGDVATVSLLLSYKADVNMPGEYNRTALHWCVRPPAALSPARRLCDFQQPVASAVRQVTCTLPRFQTESAAFSVSALMVPPARSAARSGKDNVIPMLVAAGATVDSRDYQAW